MKVRELIAYLQELDQELDVYTAKDDEGNGYNSLYWEPSEEWAQVEGRDIQVYCDEDIQDMKKNQDDLTGLIRIVVI